VPRMPAQVENHDVRAMLDGRPEITPES